MTKTHARKGAKEAVSAWAVLCAVSLILSGCFGQNDGSGSNNRSAPSSIQYTSNPLNFTIGVAASSAPAVDGNVSGFSISPTTLPTGLSFDATSGTISGTPTALTPAETYNITASNGFGTDYTTLQIAVVDVPPSISYAGTTTLSFHVGDAIATLSPTLGGGATLGCVASPVLPSGLSLSPLCELSGTPTVPLTATKFTITAQNSGGGANLSLNLTVIDNPPVISYAGGTQVYTNGQAITPLDPINTGGAVVSCTVSPALPAGLSLSSGCVISGTPTTTKPAANYTVTATNSGGSVDATVTLLVQDVPPNITYSGSPFTLTLNHTMSASSVTNSGGAIETCSVNPPLPAGLTMATSPSPSICQISGTPTSIQGTATYTITAGNTAGSSNAPITIAVNDVAPRIAYPGTPYRFTDHSAITPATPVSSGGTATSCSASPSLPAGLSLSSTCVISGTPTAGQGATSYVITASDSGGNGTTTVSIQITEIAPSLSYTGSPFTFNKAVTIPILTPTSSGGPITSCVSSPVLPSGLSLSAQCVISGAPAALASTASYTITGNNAGGASTATISITINDTPPVISYPGNPFTFYRNIPISAANATDSGGAIVSCASSPSLPAGLSLSSGCVITGTPTAVTAAASYTITATNTGGTGPATINLTVADSPPVISYVGSPLSYTKGTSVTALNPVNAGGAITTCSASPTLPSGLSLSSSCVVTGTPSALTAAAGYVITGGNSSGSSSTALTIAVNDVPPTFAYSPSLFAFTKNTSIGSVTPTTSGGAITSCVSSPSLPAGLSLGNTTCVITGTPTANSSGTSYAITATNSGGSSTFSITIGVVDLVPNIAYSGSPFTFTKGTAIATVTPTNSGGTVTSCASAPALPAGLALSTTCVITGTPTVVAATGTYVITGTNSGGTGSTSIGITVNDVAPTLAYSGSPYTFTLGTAISQIPVDTGGTITSCGSSPALPAGLSLSSACVLSGTPSAASGAANYIVTGTNTGGSANFTISIAVNQIVPVISYPASPVVAQKGTAISTLTVVNSGGPIASCAIAPALPAGLSFNTSNCAVTGNPNVISASAAYTVTATNSAGNGPATLTLTINDIAPTVSYSGSPFAFPVNSAISTVIAADTGGAITGCAVLPALPAGLSLDPTTCFISGTPTAITAAANYTVTATNSGGSATTTIAISVNTTAPNINYLATGYTFNYTKGTAIAAVTPADTGGTIASCGVTPALPGGLSLDPVLCTLSGTPAAVSSSAAYTVTATNGSGSSPAVLTITVQDVIPSIAFAGSPFTFTKGVAIATQTPTNSGGTIISCSSTPTLPAGLSLSPTCVLSGTPTVLSGPGAYTVTATNSGGSASASLNITINDQAPVLSYAGSPFTYTRNSAIATLNPANTGGTIVSCSSSPALPAGLSLSPTCVLTGTPTAPVGAANYTITAVNTGGSSPATINIGVNDIAPVIAYTGSPFSFQQNVAISPLSATSTGGSVASCASSPALPAGLSINNTTCAITGTPTAIVGAANYTITAGNGAGNGGAVINVAVVAQAPLITYAGSPFSYTKGAAITTLSPTNSGGAISTCTSAPTLPAGLSIANTTCAITGTPSVLTSATSYTITAVNAGGSSGTSVMIGVIDVAPAINYAPTTYNFTYPINSAILALIPNNTGGPIVSCGISPALPAGLSFSTTTCAITGTPTAVNAATSYSVTAMNTGGPSAQTITIAVTDSAPAIAYAGSPFSYTVNTAITPLSASSTGGAIVSCAVSPGLPNGLVLSNTCGISGTPTTLSASTGYTVTASNSGGSSSATIAIAVPDRPPTGFSYTGSPFSYTVGTAISTLTPSNTGGPITSCVSAPTLPSGLSLSTACVLSGTPNAAAAAGTYAITASNTGGSANQSITITVQDIAPSFTYAGGPYTYSLGVPIATLSPNNTGGVVTNCTPVPALPAGLSLSASCVVTGTPTAITAGGSYVLTGTNSGGTGNATINITVNDVAPSIGYSPTTLTYPVRVAIATASASNTGGAITSCVSSPTLPTGLSISPTTCAVTGTPTVVASAADFTITASNTGGNSVTTLNITIQDLPQILFHGNTALAGTWNGTAPSSMNIWHIARDGVGMTHITNNPTAGLGSVNAVANATGTSISYASIQKEGGTTSSSYNIFTSTPAGGSLTFLTANTAASRDSSNNTFVSDTVGEAPVWSPDGSKIVFSSKQKVNGTTSSSYNVWIMSATGTNVLALTQNTSAGLDSKNPIFSPDGTYVYFTSLQNNATTTSSWNGAANGGTNIWRIQTDGTGLGAITTNSAAGVSCLSPVFSPDGTTITYFSNENLSGPSSSYNIWQRTSTGGSAFALTTNTAASLDSKYPSYSPDGTEIVFSSKMPISGTTASSYNIWKMSSSGSSQTALTTNTAATLDSYEPSFSPDNQYVAFFSKMKIGGTTASSYNLWVMKQDGTGLLNLTANTSAGLDVYLAPGGRRIWYQP